MGPSDYPSFSTSPGLSQGSSNVEFSGYTSRPSLSFRAPEPPSMSPHDVSKPFKLPFPRMGAPAATSLPSSPPQHTALSDVPPKGHTPSSSRGTIDTSPIFSPPLTRTSSEDTDLSLHVESLDDATLKPDSALQKLYNEITLWASDNHGYSRSYRCSEQLFRRLQQAEDANPINTRMKWVHILF